MTARFVVWGIVAHAEFPIRITGGSNTECRRQANVRAVLPSYRNLRIVPEGEPYGEVRVRHRTTGVEGTALRVVPGNRRLAPWNFHHRDWVQVRWDDGLTCHNNPSELEFLEDDDAST